MKESKEVFLVGGKTTKERSIVTVHGLRKAAKQEATDELPCDQLAPVRFLLDLGFVEGIAATEDLNLDLGSLE